MKSEVENDYFNVGSGEEKTIKDIVKELVKISGKDIKANYNLKVKVPMLRRVGSSAKARKKLGFKTTVKLSEGLKRVYNSE